MSYRGNRSSAKKENSQNNSPHGQLSSSSGIGQAASGEPTILTPCWPPRDQGRNNEEERKGISVSRTTLEPHPAPSTMKSIPPTPLITSRDICRRYVTTKASRATKSIHQTPSPITSIPPSPVIASMTAFIREMQHDGKDTYNFYEDADTEGTVDYPTTPPESNSGSSSVWSSQSSRRSRGDTPAYDQDGWRMGGFLTSPRR
ncbi:hypothetical protein B0J15DRAFT_554198 [Fusarium solani]|uniref:Uncharacterized protein n=1 Tax=Fusarium solani TaxID=169388 RepID=A0A9P9GE99_FUSSL|nr:uncharacterized protein B0J15DRAFT_554198 [Fusarium solani]KAH7237321.1 hypothetical protein B0J15DRAFT_554198 [Fusarium solani]